MISRRRIAAGGLLLIATMWGASFIIVKEAIRSIDVISFLAARFTIAASLFIFFLRRSHFSRATISAGAGIGLALSAGYWLQTTGLQTTTASKSAFLTSLSVIFVPVWELLTGRTRPGVAILAAAAMAMTGTFLMVEAWKESIAIGDLLTIASAVAFGAHVILATRASRAIVPADPISLAFLQVGTVALLALPLADFHALAALAWPTWLAIAGTAVVNTTISFFILMWAQRHTSASEAVVLLSIEPVAALLMGAAWFRETPTIFSIAGSLFILTSVYLVQRRAEAAG